MHSTEPNIKQKNQSPMRIIVNRWGCLLGFVMLGLGAGMGLLGAIFVGPQLLGFDVTATALMEREIVLAATAVDLDTRAQDANAQATSFALDVQSTQAILNNDADLLDQTATQSAQNIIATNTTSAIQSSQRQTQVSNDFASTQAALNANATEISLDFRNTQAALGIGSAQSDSAVSDATMTALPRYSFDMSEFNFDASIWQVSHVDDWDVSEAGILANNAGAWLIESDARILENYAFLNTYTIEISLNPATVLDAEYWLLFAMTEGTGYAAYFHAETLTVNQVALYSFELSQLDESLNTDDLTVIRRNAADVTLASQSVLSVHIDGETVSLLVGDETVLAAEDIPIEEGAIGVQFPAQASLISIGVSDQ